MIAAFQQNVRGLERELNVFAETEFKSIAGEPSNHSLGRCSNVTAKIILEMSVARSARIVSDHRRTALRVNRARRDYAKDNHQERRGATH